MSEVFLDAFIDSLKVLAVLIVCNIFISVLEPKVNGKAQMKGRYAPLIGVSASLIPQCGFSVVATELYQKRRITIGTLIGVYLATSDEALPIFLADPSKALHILPILGFKFLIGVCFGYGVDIIYAKRKNRNKENTYGEGGQINISHCGCNQCAKHYETEKYGNIKNRIEKYIWHPLVHSLKIFMYIFVVNIIFGIMIFYIGEDKLVSFLEANKYIAPLFSVITGAIPNCVSSVIISELYLMNGLGFGAALGGLCMNAGLGYIVLCKNTGEWRENSVIVAGMFLISVTVAYAFSAIFGFDVLKF